MDINNVVNIIIVDDDIIHRQLLKDILNEDGYHIFEASNYDDALNICREHDIDLAILDIRLPSHSGIELAATIDPVPYIYVTQVTDKAIVELALNDKSSHRAIGYIVKPFNIESIKPTIKGALEISRYIKRNRDLLLSVSQGLEEEKKRLAQDLHDDIGQDIASLKLFVHRLNSINTDATATKIIHEISASADRISKSIVSIIDNLYPEDLEELGFIGSIKSLINRWNKIDKSCEYLFSYNNKCEDMDDIIAINLYRIIKESLTNIAKYSYATNAQVQILFDSNITIIISDNGCGFGDEGKFKGHGINNMRDRTHALGGIFNITTSEQGVRIIAHVPYKISQIL